MNCSARKKWSFPTIPAYISSLLLRIPNQVNTHSYIKLHTSPGVTMYYLSILISVFPHLHGLHLFLHQLILDMFSHPLNLCAFSHSAFHHCTSVLHHVHLFLDHKSNTAKHSFPHRGRQKPHILLGSFTEEGKRQFHCFAEPIEPGLSNSSFCLFNSNKE